MPRSAPRYLIWKHGAWYAHFRWVDPDGTVHWPSPRSPYTDKARDERRAAVWAGAARGAWIAARQAKLAAGGRAAAQGPTLGDLVALYEAEVGGRTRSWPKERFRATRLLAELGAGRAVAEITIPDVVAMRDRLQRREGHLEPDTRTALDPRPPGRPKASAPPRPGARARRRLSPRSVNAYLVLLQAVMNYAARSGAVPHNHLRYVPKLEEPRDEVPATLSARQLTAVFEALADWEDWRDGLAADLPRESRTVVPLRGIVLLAYYTAARPSNYLAMRWCDVRWPTREIVFEHTKNLRAVAIPMEAPLLCYLKGIYTGQPATAQVHPGNRTTRGPWKGLYHQWRRLLDLANRRLPADERIPLGTRLYILRHTRATDWAEAGVAPKVVADLLGDRLETVQRYYFGRRASAARYWVDLAAETPTQRAVNRAALGLRPVSGRGSRRGSKAVANTPQTRMRAGGRKEPMM